MGQPTYAVNPDAVEATAQDIMRSGTAIDQRLQQLHTSLSNYLELWLGQDKNQYEIYRQEWHNLITQMNEILSTKAGPALNRMVDNIRTTENVNSRMW